MPEEEVAFSPEYPVSGFFRLIRNAHYWAEAVDLFNLRSTEKSRARWHLLLDEERVSGIALVRHVQAHGDAIIAGLTDLAGVLAGTETEALYRLGETKRVTHITMHPIAPRREGQGQQ